MLDIFIEALMQPGGDLASLRPAWHAKAECRGMGPELFFPSLGRSSLAALQVCSRCEVSEECRTAAIADSELLGIWGGTAPQQRRELRNGHRLTADDE